MTTTERPTAPVRPVTRRPHHTLLAGGLGLSALTIAVLVLLQPWGERNALDYQTLSADRGLMWSSVLLDALAMAALGICLALVVTHLAPGRGAVWARAGGTLSAAGGVLFALGMYAFGSLAWYATETAALDPAEGTALLEYAVAHPGHGQIVQIVGFLTFTLGLVLLTVALLRAGTIGRTTPAVILALTVAAFFAPSAVLSYVQAAQMASLVLLAVAAVRPVGGTYRR